MASYEVLKKNRSKAYEILSKAIKELKDCPSLGVIQRKVSLVETYKGKFEEAQLGINLGDFENEQDRDMHENRYFKAYDEFTDMANHMIDDRSRQIVKQKKNFFSETNVTNLCPLNVPNFTGTQESWGEFRDMFISLIHNNSDLNNISKLAYLKKSLQGSAMQVIQGLENTEENYTIAWELLVERYNHSRMIIKTKINSMFNLRAIQRENYTDLRHLIDEITINIRTLQTMGQPIKHWDSILICIVLSKLPLRMQIEWENTLPNKDMPAYDSLKNFLENRCSVLQSIDASNSKPVYQNNNDFSVRTYNRQTRNFESIKKKRCHFCDREHFTASCPILTKQTPLERRRSATEKKLCFRCLNSGHMWENCHSKFTCKDCNRAHHTLLHIPQTSIVEETNFSPQTYTNIGTFHNALLATASVLLKDHDGKFHKCRALLDPGSQTNYITAKLARNLKIKQNHVHIPITMLQGVTTNTTNSINTIINSEVSNFSSDITFLILNSITGMLPNENINKSILNIPKNINMSDKYWHKPGQIDVLLGAHIFWKTLKTEKVDLGQNQPTMFETEFGWIISGRIPTLKSSSITCNLSIAKLNNQVKQLWEIEEVPEILPRSSEETKSEQHFKDNVSRLPSGRFSVKLPFKSSPNDLGNSLCVAEKRLLAFTGTNTIKKYWLLNGTNTIKGTLRKCITCFKSKPIIIGQLMGDLPSSRIIPKPPFHHYGVDYAGPFAIKNGTLRNSKITKCYVCIFICFVTKAVHMEVVSDLTTVAFLNCFKRFVARRGKPAIMWSDNGTNFVGAKRELGRILQNLFSENSFNQIISYAFTEGIQWNFIPPRSPHMGDIWESAVKQLKYHLKRIINSVNLTFESLATVIAQIEACLNSRPLTPISNDPKDLNPLTPGHFLIGRPLLAIPQSRVIETTNIKHQYLQMTKATSEFWNRWSLDYISALQIRNKWKQQKIGDLVVIKEEGLLTTAWALGRVRQIYPGGDRLIRVAELTTKNGITRRAISKLAVLPIDDNNLSSCSEKE
ncbi:uncharacterized protein LOC143922362 [Arctopsyche grandis]|uniref:uncharacterized protein LOC143922362 n=1 Tax=Arctopsyche grandis TaxID=121162 RepID=UPI00406D6388